MVRVRSWEQHFVKEGSHKDRSTRKGVCVCVLDVAIGCSFRGFSKGDLAFIKASER